MTASYNLELLYLHLQPNYNQFNYSTMAKITKEAALLYHSQGKPGKIEVVPTKPYSTQTDLLSPTLRALQNRVSKLRKTRKMHINIQQKAIW